MPNPSFLRALLLVLACLAGPAAHACTATETGGPLGSYTSQNVYSTAAIKTSASFSFACSGNLLAIASGTPSIRGEFTTALTGLTLKAAGGYTIPYQIYRDAGYTTAFTGLVQVNLQGAQVLNLLGNGNAQTVPFYIAVTPGANIPAGTYTDTIQFTWTPTAICEGLLGAFGICLGNPNTTPVLRSIVVTLVVTNDCTVTAPTVNFGTAPLVASFATVSQNIQLLCSRDMTYTVGLSDGLYPSGGRRRMASGTNRLQYDIFKADTTVWGKVGTARASSPAPANGTTVQTIPYTARIYTDQSNPPPGVYTDNVVVDISF
ncbi:spore coat protein U domain-containing protein [Pseudorhodoferax sp. Leaf267]|uniref:Csu type fimbrial protein n=1 Tax=Pseudorhodoferax sp. Leaf267 TaxID=1736316 RepID=UPI000701883E|nr:spore coat protein U domain-containing protein [Pseudorhodoferax sp. Leaf267]KQP18421.1 hypothetical protein ASF43_11495 [Pseudorhodoferax sp. Leaf267]